MQKLRRILNHLMWLGAHGLDLGAMSVFFIAFVKEKICLIVTRLFRVQECTQITLDQAV